MTERIPTDVLVEQAREQVAHYRGTPLEDQTTDHLLTALAKALEDTAAERDDWRESHAIAAEAGRKLRAERDRAHATLREIAEGWSLNAARRLARARLENP